MARPVFLLNGRPPQPIPARMEETWDWMCAVVAYDLGDPEPLATLLCSEPIPPEFRTTVGDVVRGYRPIRLKGKSNSKLPASEWLKEAEFLATGAAFKKFFYSKSRSIGDADLRMEPIEGIRKGQASARDWKKRSAEQLGVSEETVEDMLRIFHRLIEEWPTIPPLSTLRRRASRNKR